MHSANAAAREHLIGRSAFGLEVDLWFAVVDMDGNPDMAQVEHYEDCHYVALEGK